MPQRTVEDGNKCHVCNQRYIGDLMVPDAVWEEIKPPGAAVEAGLMCPSCIMARIIIRDIWSGDTAIDVDVLRHPSS